MLFKVKRSSKGTCAEEPPCEGARRAGGAVEGFSEWEIEIVSLEALMALSKAVDEPLIVGGYGCAPPSIEIYDDMRE